MIGGKAGLNSRVIQLLVAQGELSLAPWLLSQIAAFVSRIRRNSANLFNEKILWMGKWIALQE